MGDTPLYDQAGVSQFNTQDWGGSPSSSIDVRLLYDNADGVGGAGTTFPNYVTVADQGRWMHVVYYMRASTGGGATDGQISWYRKWDGDANYTTIDDLDNIEVPVGTASLAAGYDGWGSGYLMGYANAPYDVETEWLIDDFNMSTTSLLIP